MHDGSADLHHVAEARYDAVHEERVAVGECEAIHFEFLDGVYAVFLSSLSHESYVLGVGVAGESSGKCQHALDALVLLHLVEHGSLDLTADFDEAVVCAHYDDVVVLEPDVTGQCAVHEVVVDVDACEEFAASVDLDVAQCTHVADAPSEV